jgi:protein phosphatase 4 regulatory subunit 3
MYHDTSVPSTNPEGEAAERCFLPAFCSDPIRHQQPNGMDRWAPGIKEMDSTEENYFNADEEEEIGPEPLPVEGPMVNKPLELKRRRSREDDADDELLQLAQRSPNAKRTCPPHDGNKDSCLVDDDQNVNKSPSSPTSSNVPTETTLGEKRAREPDEQDEVDRLSRSAKRVVSPTDVKRKSPRGGLNGGRKITITVGKK